MRNDLPHSPSACFRFVHSLNSVGVGVETHLALERACLSAQKDRRIRFLQKQDANDLDEAGELESAAPGRVSSSQRRSH